MPINFIKFHGFGNDYIVIEANQFPALDGLGEFARRIGSAEPIKSIEEADTSIEISARLTFGRSFERLSKQVRDRANEVLLRNRVFHLCYFRTSVRCHRKLPRQVGQKPLVCLICKAHSEQL